MSDKRKTIWKGGIPIKLSPFIPKIPKHYDFFFKQNFKLIDCHLKSKYKVQGLHNQLIDCHLKSEDKVQGLHNVKSSFAFK